MEWSVVFLRVCGLCFLPLLLTGKLTLGLVVREVSGGYAEGLDDISLSYKCVVWPSRGWLEIVLAEAVCI